MIQLVYWIYCLGFWVSCLQQEFLVLINLGIEGEFQAYQQDITVISVMFFLRALFTQKFSSHYIQQKVYDSICCYIDSAVFHSPRLHKHVKLEVIKKKISSLLNEISYPRSVQGFIQRIYVHLLYGPRL